MNIEEEDARSSFVPSPQHPHKCIKSIVVDPRLSQTTWSLETTKIHNFHGIRFVISNLLKICIDHRTHILYKHMQHVYSFAMYWLLHVIYVSLLHTVWLLYYILLLRVCHIPGRADRIHKCPALGIWMQGWWVWDGLGILSIDFGISKRWDVDVGFRWFGMWSLIRWNRKHEVDWQSSWPRHATWGAVEKLVKCGYGQWIKSGELGTGTGI